MKKILSLLILLPLMAISQIVPADATALENIQITNNTTSLTATKVNVQDANGVINTIPKSDLVNVVEVNDVPSLPLVGEVGKIYVVKNLNKIYRWNGAFYHELAGSDLNYQSIIDALTFTPEKVANKSDNYTTSSSTTYASTKALVDGLGTKIDASFSSGFVPKATGIKTLADSQIYDDGILGIKIGTVLNENTEFEPSDHFTIGETTYSTRKITDMNDLTTGEYVSIKTLQEKFKEDSTEFLAYLMAILVRPAKMMKDDETGEERWVQEKFGQKDIDNLEYRVKLFKEKAYAKDLYPVCLFFSNMKK